MMAVNDESESHTITKAVIYARVSSAKQKIEGDGLNSQIKRCSEFAKRKGYDVVRTFKDEISGSTIERPAMSEMLSFIKGSEPHVVIIDDLTRLARGIMTHWTLRPLVKDAGGVLESPSHKFGEDSDSQLVENLLATVSQHQRQKNGEQVLNRMKARVMNGYWVTRAPIGYRYERVQGRGKMLFRHEPLASMIESIFVGYANGQFETIAEIIRHLDTLPYFPRDGRGLIRFSRIKNILKHPIYGGMVHAPTWNITLRDGQHEGLVSKAIFKAVQEKLERKPIVPSKANTDKDFILRGAVACSDCGWKMTSCWSKGQYKKYPYYLCQNRACASKGKSINRDKLEAQVGDLIKELQPNELLPVIGMDMFKEAWLKFQSIVDNHRKTINASISALEDDIEKLVSRLIETDNQTIIKAIEKKISKLEQDKLVLIEQRDNTSKPKRDFASQARTAIEFILNPYNTWVNGDFYTRRVVLKLGFGDHLHYHKETGARTKGLPYLFEVIQGFSKGENGEDTPMCEMVRMAGLEPA